MAVDPYSHEGALLAVTVYKRVLYLQAEGFTEAQAHDIAEQEFDLA